MEWVHINEAAKKLNKDTSTLRRHILAKHFTARKVGSAYEVLWTEAITYFAVHGARTYNQVHTVQSQQNSHTYTQELEERIKKLEVDLGKAILEKEKAFSEKEKIFNTNCQMQEQLISLSSKIVGLLEAAGNRKNDSYSKRPEEKPSYNEQTIDAVESEQNTNGQWMTTTEASKLTGIPRQTLYSRLKAGKIESRRIDGTYEIFLENTN